MRHRRSGFSLIEMLIVIGVIALLAGMTFSSFGLMRARSNANASQALVQAVRIAIADYKFTELQLFAANGSPALRRAWDVDNDGIIDGQVTDTWYWSYPPIGVHDRVARLAALKYFGFVDTVRPELPPTRIEAGTRRIIDTWKAPLRIGFAAGAYGGTGLGVWSIGPDGVDQGGAGDDLPSWDRK